MRVYEKAYAKLNLDLNIVSKRQDGFHDLKSVVIPLDFYDEIYFEFSDKNEVISNVEITDNIILKTINLFQKKYNLKRKIKATVHKNIPIGSGLGGGSANAAATLRGLNKIYGLQLEIKDLEILANQLGSDVLFCLYNKPAIISGRGEFIKFISPPEIKNILLFLSPIKILTKDVFDNHQIIKTQLSFEDKFKFYQTNDFENFYKIMANDLLPTALKINEKFNKLYQEVYKVFPQIKMTGSGSTLFIINPSKAIYNKNLNMNCTNILVNILK